jgi:hypothetical protein
MRRYRAIIVLGLGSWLAGCGANLLETASLSLRSDASVHDEKPIDLYSKIARGALTCWFGSHGSLKKAHIFHAEAAPEHSGGAVEIVIHERDQGAPSPRALRTYRVTITALPSGSRMVAENLKMPDAIAKDMRADLDRWSKGDSSCGVVGTGGWGSGSPQQRDSEHRSTAMPTATR